MSPSRGPTFNWILENQQTASGILTQPSIFNRAESNFLADQKGTQQGDPGYTSIGICLKDLFIIHCSIPVVRIKILKI